MMTVIARAISSRLGTLRFPVLTAVLVGAAIVSVLVPDPLPLLDELILVGMSIWVSSLKTHKQQPRPTKTMRMG